MEQLDLYQLVNENAYPGRGIVLGLGPSGKKALIAYFIMGRSANSRNRVFDPVPEHRRHPHPGGRPRQAGGPQPDHLQPGAHRGECPYRDQRRPDRHRVRVHGPGRAV